jgi:hypothetical protein
MRQPHAQVVARNWDEPYHDDFALRLSIRSPRPLQLVSNIEWIVDGVIASFQQETDPARAEAVARLIQPHLNQHRLTHDVVAAQCAAARLFSPPPFQLNPGHTRCHINPADHQLVAGDIELATIPGLRDAKLTGTLCRVKRIRPAALAGRSDLIHLQWLAVPGCRARLASAGSPDLRSRSCSRAGRG